MIKTIKKIALNFSAALLMLIPVLAPVTVHAATDPNSVTAGGVNCGIELDAGSIGTGEANCATAAQDPGQRVNDILKLVINIFSLVVGFVSVIMIIIGGLKYITSGGDSGNVTGAKNTIMFAVIGLVVVALAQFIVRFVLTRVSDLQ